MIMQKENLKFFWIYCFGGICNNTYAARPVEQRGKNTTHSFTEVGHKAFIEEGAIPKSCPQKYQMLYREYSGVDGAKVECMVADFIQDDKELIKLIQSGKVMDIETATKRYTFSEELTYLYREVRDALEKKNKLKDLDFAIAFIAANLEVYYGNGLSKCLSVFREYIKTDAPPKLSPQQYRKPLEECSQIEAAVRIFERLSDKLVDIESFGQHRIT